MSHIQSHHGGAEGAHNTYLVILKVHGDAIHLWARDRMALVGNTRLFRISCHNVETHPEDLASDIQVFVLNDPAAVSDKCSFQDQLAQGQPIRQGDLAIFMTGPVPSTRKASYAIDLALGKPDASVVSQQLNGDNHDTNSDGDHQFERIGRTYLYLDPEFSSQGIQRTPILADQTHKPIGQIQVEYLIVTNPVAFGQAAPRPDWLFSENRLDAGHRGAGSGRRDNLPEQLLENTIDSFNYAHRHGADMCELDVLITADGIPIVYHDFDVDAVAAQQSSNELGKFRVQVNQFTYKQLRDFRLLALHDGEGCPYTLNVPNQAEGNRPFPTLADVLDQVDETCGLNIEIKWPQMLESGKMEAKRFREINDFVDRIIRVVEEHARERRIILESFDADLVIMLRLKQNRFPVVFLTQGMTDRYERYVDTRARSVWNGIYFAQAFDLAGIDMIADYYLTLGKTLVDFIKDHNLVARAWGHMGDTNEILDMLKALDLQCVTYDRIDQIKQLTTT
uniref:Glycerophosphocholine phosphodiesterase GPCPD1 n=1 Tax=Aceria tosichella TaxID=561515 RepID=A0A6G1SJJ5_9ACAR